MNFIRLRLHFSRSLFPQARFFPRRLRSIVAVLKKCYNRGEVFMTKTISLNENVSIQTAIALTKTATKF